MREIDLNSALTAPDAVGTSLWRGTRLAWALEKVTLEVKAHGTDITHGTEFYTPIVTLLARVVGTRREDVVYTCWPVLGCPIRYFEDALPANFAHGLKKWQHKNLKPARLWEVLDYLQAVAKWTLIDLIQLVKVIEHLVAKREDVLVSLQAAADGAREQHDREGMHENAPGMTEGIVIPATTKVQ